ncbi:winged helix-turn-helix domain-containing protein [Streptomyces sp. NPDC017993]|uniref:winged helix-turn-helix domain-containing protein n=1 Tax=Streptomyces sp. NPDC017993 TaxID=3365027 RepID=UPI0037B58ECB
MQHTPSHTTTHTQTHAHTHAQRHFTDRTPASGRFPSVEDLLTAARSRLDRLTPRQAADELADGALLVDLRHEPTRRLTGEIPGALLLDRNDLEWRLDPCSKWRIAEAADHNLRVILLCTRGYVSSLAAAGLHDLGLHRTTDVIGGFEAWQRTDCPVAHSVTMTGSYVGAQGGTITLDHGEQRMVVNGRSIPLTRMEFKVMAELLRSSGRVVSRDELRACIGDWAGSHSRSVDLHVHRIRRKLGPGPAATLTTEWGVGFRLRTGGG